MNVERICRCTDLEKCRFRVQSSTAKEQKNNYRRRKKNENDRIVGILNENEMERDFKNGCFKLFCRILVKKISHVPVCSGLK